MAKRSASCWPSLNAPLRGDAEGTTEWQDWLADEDADQAAAYAESQELDARRELLIEAMRDLNEEEPLEIEASKHNLNYIKLDGNVGCMVNGAGLAMATMDIIKLAGGEPANFLDVGGGATQEMVENAFRILMSDENVKAVLINIFGGILRCDVLARGVVEAVKSVEVDIPVVVRLEGTNVEQGREILQTSGLEFTVATGMGDAAEKVVAAAQAAG